MVAEPGQRIGLGLLADGVVGIGVAQCDGSLGREELHELEVAVAEVHLRAADPRDVQGAEHLSVGDERDHHDRLGILGGAGDLEGSGVAERVVGEDRLRVLDRPAHEPATEGDDVAADLVGVPLAGQHRLHGAQVVVDPVDRQVVVRDHVPQAVGNRLEHAGLVERREQPLVDIEQPSLGVGTASELGRLRHQPLVGRGVGDGLRRVAGEDAHRLEVVIREAVVAELAEDDDPEHPALVEHRHHEHRLGNVIGARDRLAALVVQRVVDQQRLAMLGHPAGEALAHCDPQQVLRVGGVVGEHFAGECDRLAHAALGVDLVDADVVVLGQRARLGNDGLGDGADVRQAVEPCGEILNGLHAGSLRRHRAVEAGVLDGDRRLIGEGLRQGHLLRRPGSIATVVEAQQAQRLVATDERHEAHGSDALGGVRLTKHADALVDIGIAHPVRPPLPQRAQADGVLVAAQRRDVRQEVLAELVLRGDAERKVPLGHQPQAGPVGLEQGSRQVDHLAEDGVQVERAGQLLGDRAQGTGTLKLSARPSEQTRAGDGGGNDREQRAEKGRREGVRRSAVDHEQAGVPAPRAEAERHVCALPCAGTDDRFARGGWRLVEAGVRLQLQSLPIADVDGDPFDGDLGAQRLDDGPGDPGAGRRCCQPGGDAREDGQLAVAPRGARSRRWRRIGARSVLDQQPGDIVAAEPAVAARVDAVRRQAAAVGPGANRVRMHTKEGGCLRHAEKRVIGLGSGHRDSLVRVRQRPWSEWSFCEEPCTGC